MKQAHQLQIGADHVTHVIEISGEPAGEQGILWIDFRCWSVVGWEGPSWEDPLFGVQGETMVDSFTRDFSEATPDFTGFVKWDGCNEFRYEGDSPHGCDGIEGLRVRHQTEEACLRLAHAAMVESGCVPEWKVPT